MATTATILNGFNVLTSNSNKNIENGIIKRISKNTIKLDLCVDKSKNTGNIIMANPKMNVRQKSTLLSDGLLKSTTATSLFGGLTKKIQNSNRNNSNKNNNTINNCININTNSGSASHIPSDILDDLASRFIINVPDDERNNLIRICFQIELAHWFYLDFFCSIENSKLVPCGMKQFAALLFQHIPFLRAHLSEIDKILEDWKQYKLSVPTYGAILISEDLKHVLLVQSYWAKSSWGFPKGKVNEHEDPVHCATREVYEETGFDISSLIVPNDYVEAIMNYQYTRLYIVRNVPIKTVFSPRTRNEIKCIEWFPVDSLPTNKNDIISKQNLGINPNSFFMIMPFIKRLKKWVCDNQNDEKNKIVKITSERSITDINDTILSSSLPRSSTFDENVFIFDNKTSMIIDKADSSENRDDDNTIKVYNKKRYFNKNSQHQYNNIDNAVNNTNKNAINKKRQRHKSLGDIESMRLNVNTTTSAATSNCYFSDNLNYYNNKTKSFSNNSAGNTINNNGTKQINHRLHGKCNTHQNYISQNNNNNNTQRSITSSSGPKNKKSNYTNKLLNIQQKLLSDNCSDKNNSKVHKNQTNGNVDNKQLSVLNIESPNFDSWTNFTFSKSFLSNVF